MHVLAYLGCPVAHIYVAWGGVGWGRVGWVGSTRRVKWRTIQ